jgi:hypothetical protein
MKRHSCLPEFSSCPCTTCAKDPPGDSDASCCLAHGLCCGDDNGVCPDYVREEDTNDAD